MEVKIRNNESRLVKYSLIIYFSFWYNNICASSNVAEILISVFATKGTNLFDISLDGFMLFSLAYLVAGINIFVSGMFTAYSNGKVSALISLLRTFIFFGVGMLFLPNILRSKWSMVSSSFCRSCNNDSINLLYI